MSRGAEPGRASRRLRSAQPLEEFHRAIPVHGETIEIPELAIVVYVLEVTSFLNETTREKWFQRREVELVEIGINFPYRDCSEHIPEQAGHGIGPIPAAEFRPDIGENEAPALCRVEVVCLDESNHLTAPSTDSEKRDRIL